MIEEKLTDQEKARIDKLPRYRELGVDPFGSRYDWKDQIRDLRANYGELSAEELKEKAIKVNVAGRLMALRKMGKAAFGNMVPSNFGLVFNPLEKRTTRFSNCRI